MFNAGILAAAVSKVIRGEQLYQGTNTTGSWVCPTGVTSVSVVLIGMGGTGITGNTSVSRSSAGGGALVYKNNHTVVPGNSYSYSITSSGTTIFGMTAGAGSNALNNVATPQPGGVASASGSPTAGFNGGDGVLRAAGNNNNADGGSAGNYTSAGYAGGGDGRSVYGPYVIGYYGNGGGNYVGSSPPFEGQGAIRIIWGPGRSFPYNAA